MIVASAEPHAGRTAARSVAVSVAAQLAAKAVNFGLNVVVGLALIRYFGPAAYGDYVFVISLCALLGLLSDFESERGERCTIRGAIEQLAA